MACAPVEHAGQLTPRRVSARQDFRGRNATTTALLVSEALLPGAAAKALAEQDAHLSVAASAPAQGVSNLKQH